MNYSSDCQIPNQENVSETAEASPVRTLQHISKSADLGGGLGPIKAAALEEVTV